MNYRKICAVLLLGALILLHALSTASASKIPAEYTRFRSICILIESDPSTPSMNRKELESVYETVSERVKLFLRSQDLSFPVETTRACFRNTITQPDQLSLWLYLAVARAPEGSNLVAVSIILHSYYGSDQKSPHNYPTKIVFCKAKEELSQCTAAGIVDYLEQTLFTAIDISRKRLKGAVR